MNLLQPFAVDMMPEEHLWAYSPVNLGHNDTLRQETSVHTHLVGLPLVNQSVDVER